MADEIRRLSDDLARDPSSLVFMPLADALRRTGQLDVALRVAMRGLDRHPYVADAHDVLARIHADRGDLERAADEWEMALRLDPGHGPARLGLGFIDFRRGNLESAERRLAAANAGEPDASIAAALAHVRTALTARQGEAMSNGASNGASDGAALEAIAATVTLDAPPAPAPENVEASEELDYSPPSTAPMTFAPSAPVLELPAPDVSRTRHLFSPVLDGADQTALLVDTDGLVLAGSYSDASGGDVSELVAAELAGVSGEAERAMRHLGLGRWTSLLVEADNAVVAMTPAPLGSLLVVATSRETPVGLVRLLLDRALTRARDWLARVS
jgi:predicted regulator of Ras-like GTPase activity (Roadblock/LC7/MglB family)